MQHNEKLVDFELEKHELESLIWKKISIQLEKRLESARKKNDSKLSEQDTARLRGRIAELKYLLSLGKEKPTVKPQDFPAP